MNKIFTGLMAAVLSLGIMGSTMQTADAGKRERRIAAGIGLGLLGAAIIGSATRDRSYHRGHRYKRHHRHYRKYRHRDRYHSHRRYKKRYYKRRYAPVRHRYSAAHKGWCSTKYRSYRAWDNTFQPYHGPRRACYSPYN